VSYIFQYFFVPLWSVDMSVGRPDDVRSVSWEPFIRLLYFVRGLMISRGRLLLILRSISQRSRLFNTGNRNILSAEYLIHLYI
jgi:hypothetical protein